MDKVKYSKINNKRIYILMILFFVLSLSLINKGIFHHDTVQVISSVNVLNEEKELSGAVNGRHMYVITVWFFDKIMPFDIEFNINFLNVILGTVNLLLIYLLFLKWRVSKAFILTLLCASNPLYLSLSTIGKSNMLLLTYVLCILLVKNDFIKLFFFIPGLFVRTEILLLIPYFIYKKRYDLSLFMLLFTVLKFSFVKIGTNDLNFNILNIFLSLLNSLIYIITIFNISIILIILFNRSFNKDFMIIIISFLVPLSLTNVVSPRLMLPLIPFVYYFLKDVKNNKYLYACILLNLVLILPLLHYRHYNSNSEILSTFLLKNDVYNVTFDKFTSDEAVFVSYYTNITVTDNASQILTVQRCVNDSEYFFTTYENYHKAEIQLSKRRVYLCDNIDN